jgi:hypothetical protein
MPFHVIPFSGKATPKGVIDRFITTYGRLVTNRLNFASIAAIKEA